MIGEIYAIQYMVVHNCQKNQYNFTRRNTNSYKNALLLTKSQRNLLSFKEIRQNGLHIKIVNETILNFIL